jgi:hypothetical protein
MTHHFNPEVAASLGINQAIVLYNLGFMQTQRAIQGGDEYYFDGRWWVRHSYESLAEWHTYMTVPQIKRVMKPLIEADHVVTWHPERFNRTTYWSVAPEFLHSTKSNDAKYEIVPSESTKSYSVLHDNKHKTTKDSCASLFAIFWDNYPRKTNKKLAQSAFKTAVKDEDTLNSIITNIQERIEGGDWELNNKGFIPHPSTYLNGRRWEDEVVPRTTHKPNSTEIARRNSQAVSDDFTKVSEDFAWIGKN